MRSGSRVLDVAAGNGNASLAAARRFCEVVSTDYVPALLELGRKRAEGDRLSMQFREADAEHLPFADAEFDAVLSTFGVMFTPDQERAAREMLRVCRPGGKIGLANWTPDSFIGQLFRVLGKYIAAACGREVPVPVGHRSAAARALPSAAATISAQTQQFVFRYRSPAHWLEVFRTYYGPVHKAFAALKPEQQVALERDIMELMQRYNRSGDATLVAAQRLSGSGHHPALAGSAVARRLPRDRLPRKAVACALGRQPKAAALPDCLDTDARRRSAAKKTAPDSAAPEIRALTRDIRPGNGRVYAREFGISSPSA